MQKLVATIRRLRAKDGCPWDKKQTTESLSKYLQEEVNELIVAIQKDDMINICEECGDLLYLIIMISEISKTNKNFTFSDVIECIEQKLVRRHPHVFAGRPYKNEEDLARQWQQIKAEEKRNKSV